MAQEYTFQPSPRLRTSKNVFDFGVTGNWTPGVRCVNPTDLSIVYGSRSGIYIRNGDLVYLNFIVNFTPTFTTSTGSIQITNLPFLYSLVSDSYGAVHTSNVILSAGYTFFGIVVNSLSGIINITECGSSVVAQSVNIQTGLASGTAFYFAGQVFYRVSDVT